MKKILIAVSGIILSFSGYSQDFALLRKINFFSGNDYKRYEKEVHSCADYILKVPVSGDSNRVLALQTVIKWMRGTPDFTFELDNSVINLTRKDEKVMGVYMAAMTKYVLENPGISGNPEDVTYHSFLLFLDYCENPANGVLITRRIQKAIDAKNDHRLKKYLQL